MNSVSRPSLPSRRAASASAAGSGVAKGLLPSLRLPDGAHADRLVERRGAAVGAVDRQLGDAQARLAEGVEQPDQQRPAMSPPARPRVDREDRDVADVALPALAEAGADEALVVVEHEPQRRI